MDKIFPIVQMLDRENALELDNNERTYEEDHEPISVEWNSLFPKQGGSKGDQDWEVNEDPWESRLPDEIIEEIIGGISSGRPISDYPTPDYPEDVEQSDNAIWEICAWYQPIHYFGYDWGIYIREDCLLKLAADIARKLRIDPAQLSWHSSQLLAKAIIRSAFAAFFLHEHFHHKVESFGLRMHVALGRSAYLPYKNSVYRPSYLTDNCLEEAMANADSHRRLATQPYSRLIGKAVLRAARVHLEATFLTDPPGYRLAKNYLTQTNFDAGTRKLQGQVKEALLAPTQPAEDWLAAKRLLQSYFSVSSNIYTVVPRGKRSFLPSKIIPKTCGTRDMIKLYKSYGYSEVPGGKGSHVKMKKRDCPTMHLPGNRKSLSPGVLNGALKNLGHSIDDLDQLMRHL